MYCKNIWEREVCERVVCVRVVCDNVVCYVKELSVGERRRRRRRERTGAHNRKQEPYSLMWGKNIHTFPRILNALKVLGLICFLPSRSCCCCYLERSEMEGSVVWPTVALAKSRCQLCNTSVIFNMFGILWTCCLLTPLLVWICIYIYICIYLYIFMIHTYIYIYIQYIYIYIL